MAISRTKAATIILMFSMAISIFALPLANAQGSQRTYPFIDATPNPVGVGEQCLIRIGISQALGVVDQGWEGLMVEMRDPDEQTSAKGPYRTDSTGGTAFVNVFDEVGTWQIRLHFPEQEVQESFFDFERGFVEIPEGKILEESYTEWFDVIVTEEPNVPYPDQPLPTEYWTRPIDPQLRMWSFVAGNWRERGRNSIAEWNDDAPETAHVLWTTPITTGGLTGGLWYPSIPASSETGDAYEGKFQGAIVLNGILYWQTGGARSDPDENTYTVATDLHTGVELWRSNELEFDFGQILYFNSYNYDGVFTYLVDNYNFYDPYTGNWQFAFTDVPSGTRLWGPSGEILVLQINYADRWMALWNSTATGFARLGAASPDYGSWGNTVHGRTQNVTELGEACYSWNVTLDATYQTSTTFGTPAMGIYLDEQRVTGLWYNLSGVRTWGVDFDGNELFDRWWDAPAEWEDGFNTLHVGGVSDFYEDGIVFVWNKENRQHYAFSVETGQYLWVTESEHYLDWYGWGAAEHTWFVYEDHLYSTGVGGILYAYNIENGETDWTYYLDDDYNEPVTGLRWWGWITLIADGKVYLGTCEHSAEQPLPRGAPLAVLNATTGEEIWRVNGMFRATRWGGNAVMGDSIYATMDTYDQRVYAVGKGPTMTTVTAPDNGVPFGSSVMIRGTVMDVSPGTKSPELTLRFPSGVSAVSDGNMSEWMLHVYKQFSYAPHDLWNGVEVTLYVVDANMNAREIGTATTSVENGAFAYAWTPDIPGTYYLYAEFKGSKAYYGSHAETAFVVDEAIEPATPPPTSTTGSLADAYILPGIIGIIVAVVVIGLVIILMLRKR
jgi:hypothetical protein